jgi:hypothetical protein
MLCNVSTLLTGAYESMQASRNLYGEITSIIANTNGLRYCRLSIKGKCQTRNGSPMLPLQKEVMRIKGIGVVSVVHGEAHTALSQT